ncbi:MAG: hypothetical protein KC425_04295 [Anaerolineales bacterium]|nr:hypothetical protein [Anaerolineales bacterium]
MDTWEYFTTFIEARMEDIQWHSEPMIPPGEHPKFSPYALIPELNQLGAKGWELVHMQPVLIGRNHDVMVHPNNMVQWSNTYFCVFKRRA